MGKRLSSYENFIDCRQCDSPYCDGCNIYRLATALKLGYLDWAKDDHNGIQLSRLKEGDPNTVQPQETSADR